jgi:hypothetical protein
MTKFLADKIMPEYLLHYPFREFRAHTYYSGYMKGKSAISSQIYTAAIFADLQVTAEGLIKVFPHYAYCFLH